MSSRSIRHCAGWAIVACLAACAARPAQYPGQPAPGRSARQADEPHFWNTRLELGRPPADSIRNVNGSPRIENPAFYAAFLRDYAPLVKEWSNDNRLGLNPNFVAALAAKESGFDPLATSAVPAYGIAQMTHIADLDLLDISKTAPAFQWMHVDVISWPRMKVVHDPAATKPKVDSLVRRGVITPRAEYLFEPRSALRASMFWTRMLATIWTENEWPGLYGDLVRSKLGAGPDGKIRESDLLALVIVSYNQGHVYVADLVKAHGRDWTKHLNAEASDYLERILVYTAIFQRAAFR